MFPTSINVEDRRLVVMDMLLCCTGKMFPTSITVEDGCRVVMEMLLCCYWQDVPYQYNCGGQTSCCHGNFIFPTSITVEDGCKMFPTSITVEDGRLVVLEMLLCCYRQDVPYQYNCGGQISCFYGNVMFPTSITVGDRCLVVMEMLLCCYRQDVSYQYNWVTDILLSWKCCCVVPGKMFPTSITVEDRLLVVMEMLFITVGDRHLVMEMLLCCTGKMFPTSITVEDGCLVVMDMLLCCYWQDVPYQYNCGRQTSCCHGNMFPTSITVEDRRLVSWTNQLLTNGRSGWKGSVAFAPGKTGHTTTSPVCMCCGRQGYIPHFNPQHGLYGCAGQTENLHTVLRILDVDSPHLMDRQYNGLHFNAESSLTTTTFTHTSDGFLFDPSPLFRGEEKSLWFVQVIFSLHTDTHTTTSRTRKLQSTESNKREKGPGDDLPWTGTGIRGTNMALLVLDREGEPAKKRGIQSDQIPLQNDGQLPIIAALIGAGVLLLIGLFIIVIYIRHRRKQTSPPPTPSGTITVMSTSPGHTKVISNSHTFKPGNPSEV
ncbi:hypothetical protein DPMN_106526 [Dreissena polymorpha]|uniref:Uncharacterized protein n=1 Tax=Dreissena polymorpha TaxID=45954 RepID=A0A9D4K556_DREPO|nr:hypothetical protein DPMN_106526 [Dreissena polymorpha]